MDLVTKEKNKINENYQEEIYKRVCDGFLSITLDLFIMYDEEKIKLVHINSKYVEEENLGILPDLKYKPYIENETIYNSHKELFKSLDMSVGIENDLEDMRDDLYDENGNWTYAISKEDILKLQSFGEKIDIIFLENNKDTLDYTNHNLTNCDKVSQKVIQYFKENDIENLMEYGSDSDEGLYHLSSMYSDIMDELEIKYNNIYTKDGISDGKYLTTITFENDSQIEIDTRVWNDIESVIDNVSSILEEYERLITKELENKNNEVIEMDI